MTKAWTEPELNLLRDSRGKIQPEIQGRSPESVRQKLLRLGIKTKAKVPQWTKRELSLLKKAAKNGEEPFIEGRSPGSIRNKMTQLGLRVPNRTEWKRNEIKIIKSFNAGDIPEVPGRSREAVRSKMRELGLVSNSRNWSPKEIGELRIKVAGNGDVEIRGRTAAAVSKKIHDLGLLGQYLANRGKGKSSLKWSEEELEMIRGGAVEIEGRSTCSVMNMRRRLGFKTKRKPRKYWTDNKEKLIRKLHSKGMSARDMISAGHFPKRTTMAVQKKLCRMGLAKTIKTKRMKEIVKLRLKKFLSERWEGRSTDELAEMWNLEHDHKIGRSTVARLLLKMNIKVRCHEIQKMNNLRKKEIEIFAEGAASSKILDERIRAHRVKLMRERFEKNRGVFTGMDLEEEVLAETPW